MNNTHDFTYIFVDIFKYIILSKTCKIRHNLCQNTCMFIVTYFIFGCFKNFGISSLKMVIYYQRNM